MCTMGIWIITEANIDCKEWNIGCRYYGIAKGWNWNKMKWYGADLIALISNRGALHGYPDIETKGIQ